MNTTLTGIRTASRPARTDTGGTRAARERSLRGRLTALAAAAAVVLSGAGALAAEPAWARDGGAHGDWQTFAEQLPMAEIHLDTTKLRDPNVQPDEVNIPDPSAFAVRDGYIVLNEQLKSNTTYSYDEMVASFVYKDAATLSDGTTANVDVDIFDLTIHTGAANAGKSTSTEDLLAGTPTIATDDGKQMSARVLPDPDPEGSDTWRYGLEAKVNVFVEGASGSFVTGLTGMTIDRSGTTSYRRIPNAADHDWFSESVVIIPDQPTAPVYYPAEGYGADVYADENGLHIVGAGRNGSQKTGIDGKKWDSSFLTGFITEADAYEGLYLGYRGSAGVAGDTVYKMNTMLFPAGQAYRFETSSSEGGTVQFTKNGGKLTDGSQILGPGHYSAPRGKAVRLTMTPEQAIMRPKLAINGEDVTADIERHEERDIPYFTYDVPAAFSDTTAEVTWTDQVPTGDLKVRILWNDTNDKTHRPNSVTAHITATTERGKAAEVFDGSNETDVTLSGSSSASTYTRLLPNLPATYNGETVWYSFDMDAVAGYSIARPRNLFLTEGSTKIAQYQANLTH